MATFDAVRAITPPPAERVHDVEKSLDCHASDSEIPALGGIAREDSDSEQDEKPFLDEPQQNPPAKPSVASAVTWMAVNIVATVMIVFTNKAIFSDDSLRYLQLTFAAFHFLVTWLTLRALSSPPPRFFFFLPPSCAVFAPRRAGLRDVIPLSVAMALNVVLPNLSLAFSTVTFYQVARILLTPVVALMNFFMYGRAPPRPALLALVPACAGVAMVSYYDSIRPAGGTEYGDNGDGDGGGDGSGGIQTTSAPGVVFALSGIVASSLYTVWIASQLRRLQMSSMQLLHNQAPVSAFLLLYVIPFADRFPALGDVAASRWVLMVMSALLASLINISQFFIVAQTGPVSSTVVGHVKTCTIVALGWATSGRSVGDKSVVGILIALGGIISYSVIMLRTKA